MKWPRPSLSTSLRFADRGDWERCPEGEAGEMALEGCDGVSDGEPRTLSGMFVSDALLISLPCPMPFFCLNFSNQLELLAFRRPSAELPMVAENRRTFSLMSASVTTAPDFCALRM
jgi:hypothetical protein